MSSSPSTPDDPGLFDDLPLHAEEPPKTAAPPTEIEKEEIPLARSSKKITLPEAAHAEELSLLFDESPEGATSATQSKPAPEPETRTALEKSRTEPKPESKPRVPAVEPQTEEADLARPRLVAGLADLGVVLAVAVSTLGLVALMGITLTPLPWVPMALFLTAFSFLYCVFPLAFWGRTPGMAWQGLRARSLDGHSLSFGQTAWRWLAALATVVTFGLPLILTLKGTYLSDLLSKSRVEYSAR